MKRYCALAMIAGYLMLSGCVFLVPYCGEVVIVPEFEGKVLDADSSQPIEGVLLIVDNRPESSVTTQPDGSFHMKEIRHSYYIKFIEPGGVAGYQPPAGDILWCLKTSHPLYIEKYVSLSEYIYEPIVTEKPRGPLIIRLEPK